MRKRNAIIRAYLLCIYGPMLTGAAIHFLMWLSQ